MAILGVPFSAGRFSGVSALPGGDRDWMETAEVTLAFGYGGRFCSLYIRHDILRQKITPDHGSGAAAAAQARKPCLVRAAPARLQPTLFATKALFHVCFPSLRREGCRGDVPLLGRKSSGAAGRMISSSSFHCLFFYRVCCGKRRWQRFYI